MSIYSRRVFNSDGNHAPHWPFELNKDSPQAQGEIVGFWPGIQGRGGLIDLAGLNSGVLAATTTFAPGPFNNIVTDYAGDGNNPRIDIGTLAVKTATGFSFATWCVVDANAHDYTRFFGTGSSDGIQISTKLSNQSFAFLINSVIDANGVGAFVYGEPVMVGYAIDANGYEIYVDGVSVHTDPSTITDKNEQFWMGGDGDPDRDEFDGQMWNSIAVNWRWPSALFYEFWAPGTRWDLYWQSGRVTYFAPAAAAAGIVPLRMMMGLGT